MEVTFYKKSKKAMRSKDNISNKCDKQDPTPQRKLFDYLGLTLKEYFSNAGQKPSLKSFNKRLENCLVNKKLSRKGFLLSN
jgi:hypothetical protein